MYYIHKDYPGSYQTITDAGGHVVERLSFDPWGRRRNAQTWTFSNVPSSYLFDRGFTGHQHMDHFALINMGGRVYDPVLGNFLSPDPFVQAPANPQNYNRYGYALNNPLKYTDPTGYQTASAPGAVSWLGGGGGWGESGLGFGGNVNWDYFANMNLYTNWQGKQVGFMDTPINLDPGQDAGITYTGEEAKNMFIRMFSPGIQTHIYVFFGKIYVVISDGPPGDIYGSEEKGFSTSDPSKTAVSTGETSVTGKAGNGGSAGGSGGDGGLRTVNNTAREMEFLMSYTDKRQRNQLLNTFLGTFKFTWYNSNTIGKGPIKITTVNGIKSEISLSYFGFGMNINLNDLGFSVSSFGITSGYNLENGFNIGCEFPTSFRGSNSGFGVSYNPNVLGVALIGVSLSAPYLLPVIAY